MRGTEAERCLKEARTAYAENRFEDALTKYNEATRLGVDRDEHTHERWMCLMMLGDFQAAWQETDRTEDRRRRSGESTDHVPPHLRRVWNGTAVTNKRVLVRCYHGLGDTIQFVRYIPMLGRMSSAVILQPQESLAALLRDVSGIQRIVSSHQTTEELDANVEVELMELPYMLRTSAQTIPAAVPYLHVPEEQVKARRGDLEELGLRAELLNIGLVWSSGDWNPERNVDLAELRRLGRIEGLRVFSLQRGDAKQKLREHAWIVDAEDEADTILDTAAAILNLDLIISVDTMVAHLAGALGKPVWLLLPFAADWRWMAHREDSPWYPTMRLFRQKHRGNWEQVIERVILRLLRLKSAEKVIQGHTSCGSSSAFS